MLPDCITRTESPPICRRVGQWSLPADQSELMQPAALQDALASDGSRRKSQVKEISMHDDLPDALFKVNSLTNSLRSGVQHTMRVATAVSARSA